MRPRARDTGGMENPVARVQRWATAGGTWQVLSWSGSSATVALCRCDGGEEVERIVSADAALLTFLMDRTSSED